MTSQTKTTASGLQVVTGSIGWGAACAAFVFNFASFYGIFCAFSGACGGVIVSSVMLNRIRPSSRAVSGPLRYLMIFPVILFFISIVLPAAVKNLCFLNGYITLISTNCADILFKSGAFVMLMRLIGSRSQWAGAFEALVAAVLFSRPFSAHARSMTSPFWLIDFFTERNQTASEGLYIVGICCVLVFFLILLSQISLKYRFLPFLGAAILFILSITMVHLFSPLYHIAPVSGKIPRPLAADLPPPPPSPKPIALIEFLAFYNRTEKPGGYFFRTYALSMLDTAVLKEGKDAHFDRDILSDIPEKHWQYSNLEIANITGLKFLCAEANVLHLDENIGAPLLLLTTIGLKNLQLDDRRFTAGYEITVFPPGSDIQSLNDGSITHEMGGAKWDKRQWDYYTQIPNMVQLVELKDQIINDIPEHLTEFPGKRLKAIVNWMNKKYTFSSRSESDDPVKSVSEFLFHDLTGGYRQFSQAAALLLRAAGIPARVAQGYYYPILHDEIKSEILITNAHQMYWPEVYLRQSGWIPVMLRPENVLDRNSPPPLNDLEHLISREKQSIHKKNSPAERYLPFSVFMSVILIPLTFFLIINFGRRWGLCIFSPYDKRPFCLYRTAIDLVSMVGYRRRYGQTREEFSREILEKAPDVGVCFRQMTEMYLHSFNRAYSKQLPLSTWYRLVFRLEMIVTRRWFRLFRMHCTALLFSENKGRRIKPLLSLLNPLCWLNADRPTYRGE